MKTIRFRKLPIDHPYHIDGFVAFEFLTGDTVTRVCYYKTTTLAGWKDYLRDAAAWID